MYPPSIDFMICFIACLKIGVIAVPVFPPNPAKRDTLHMFSKICESCGAKFALTNSEYNHVKKIVGKCRCHVCELATNKKISLLHNCSLLHTGIKDAVTKFKQRPIASWPEQLNWIVTDDKNKLSKKSATSFKDYNPSQSDIAFLQYTSGSTSEPKGVMITHGNLSHNLTIITNDLQAKNDTIVSSWLPQYHDMGLIGSYLGVIYCGGSGYYMSPLSFLQRPMLWIETVSKFSATHLQAPNFAFKLTSRKSQTSNASTTLDLSSVRHIINAAEPVDEESMQIFYETFAKYGLKRVIFPTYGLAEHTVFVCSGGKQIISVDKAKLEVDGKVIILNDDDKKKPKNNDTNASRLVGCGYPKHQGVDVRIVDRETCKELDTNSVGEIWIQSPSKAAGYFQKDVESREDFHAKLQGGSDGDGYLRTGDLGFLYNDELFICGRLKDLIIVGGRNYYPQDLEVTAEATSDTLRPGCSAAFTIDPTKGGDEEVALVMELRNVPSSNDIEKVCDPLADQVFKSINQEHSLGIAQILFLKTKTVPKTTSGKIARAWCRKGFLGGSLQVVYRKSFKKSTSNFEIEQSGASSAQQQTAVSLTPAQISELRSMDRQDILKKLMDDVSNITSLSPELIDKEAALVTILDSMSISQFTGMLASSYGVKVSDHYLFNETTTLTKLSDIVKLGYAPDDEGGEGGQGAPSDPYESEGKAKGLAGALGCPPGVVLCTIL